MHNFTWFQTIKSKLRFTAALLAALVLFGACGSSDGAVVEPDSAATETAANSTTDETPTDGPANPSDGESASAPVASSDAAAETPAGHTLTWVVDYMLNTPNPDTAQVEARFSPDFLAAVPIEQVVGFLPELQRAGPWSVDASDVGELSATAVLVAADGTELEANLAVGAGEPTLIEGLVFSPKIAAVAAVATADEYAAALSAVAPRSPAAIFEVIDGECSAVVDLGAEEIMPIGSIFKLWVLAELAHQIDTGVMSWDDTIPVQDIYKSSPDSAIYQMEEGRELSLFELAAEMISVSDNTATDHLLFHLGRENVEQAMARIGIAQPERNIPMLATAELFRIKFDPTPPNSGEYRALDGDGRRSMLDAMEDSAPSWVGNEAVPVLINADGVPADQPRDHDLEWFATPLDLCRTHVHLANLAEIPGLVQVADIVRTNADARLPFDRDTWTDLRFKGGSEPGLVAVAWRMERNDGRTFVLAGGVEDTQSPIDPATAVSTLALGVDLAAAVE